MTTPEPTEEPEKVETESIGYWHCRGRGRVINRWGNVRRCYVCGGTGRVGTREVRP